MEPCFYEWLYISHCILIMCIHHVSKMSDTHSAFWCVTLSVNKTFVYEKTQQGSFLKWIFSVVQKSSVDRSFAVDVWLPLFVWAECVFVSVLLSLTLVSRMFNYMLCHVSTAELGFVMAGLVCFFLSLTTILPPRMILSCDLATLYYFNQTDKPWRYTLWKMQPGAARLTLAEQVKFRQRLPKSKAVKRSILVSFHLPWQHLHRSVLQCGSVHNLVTDCWDSLCV